ncbi:GerA spore germination protein [Peribacillus simplex]|uniref:GerA spore germination protein n=1 Tax=Peribacillus simplex TaxID=1478 RepID=A0A9X8RDW1_9BACI|nr:spore germination protein [Peribacillus simplex]SIS03812.1 GerA spore germination protein [Peribacillus simplex]
MPVKYLSGKKTEFSQEYSSLKELLEQASKSSDFYQFTFTNKSIHINFYYYNSLVDEKKIHEHILPSIQSEKAKIKNLQDLINHIPIEGIEICSDLKEIILHLTQGYIYIQLAGREHEGIIVSLVDLKRGYRDQNDSENEYSVVGPKVGFVEDLSTNINLLRKNIVSEKLIFEEHTIGSISKTRVVIAYLEGVTNPEHVNTVRQRLVDLDFDIVYDSSNLDQIISDNSKTPFPLLFSTERVDRATYMLSAGQVAILSSGSPYLISGPTTVFDFFVSPEDYYLPWILGSFFRLVRYIAVLLSILGTPIYVAIVTFHYEMVPKDLLGPIIESRADVPFPPLIEAIFLEITIELLREAGARLPTKVGQTLGIVGGIVIGQAAVQAALTSNILLIIVSLSALSSFTTPIFKMSNTIRFLRFPLIVLASIWGGFGIIVGITVLLGHLLRLKSLGTPYLVPLYPFRPTDLGDTFYRSSFSLTSKRPSFLRPLHLHKYKVKKNKDVMDDYNNE